VAPRSLPLATIVDGIMSLMVKGFFANRIRRLTKQWYLAAICFLLATLHFGALLALSILGFTTIEIVFLNNYRWLIVASASVSAIADILIAATLVHNLLQKKRSFLITSSNSTMQVLDHLIVSTLRTGMASSMTTLSLAVCLIVLQTSLAWVAIYVCLTRVYSNAFFAALNSRRGAHDSRDTVHAGVKSILFAKTVEGSHSHVLAFPVDVSMPSGNSQAQSLSDHNLSPRSEGESRGRSTVLFTHASSDMVHPETSVV